MLPIQILLHNPITTFCILSTEDPVQQLQLHILQMVVHRWSSEIPTKSASAKTIKQ